MKITQRIWRVCKKAKELWDWISLAWLLAGALGIGGIALSIASTIWAMVSGLPGAFIVMGAFCTFVAAVWLALAPLAFQAFRGGLASTQRDKPKPNYSLWRNRRQIDLGEAACLFADLVPRSTNRVLPNVQEYLWSLIDAAKNNDMEFVYRDPGASGSYSKEAYERQYVDDNTKVTLDALRGFAKKRGYTPPFLRDED